MASRSKREPKFKDLFRIEARQEEIQADLDKISEETYKMKKAAAQQRVVTAASKPDAWPRYVNHTRIQGPRTDRPRPFVEEILLPR